MQQSSPTHTQRNVHFELMTVDNNEFLRRSTKVYFNLTFRKKVTKNCLMVIFLEQNVNLKSSQNVLRTHQMLYNDAYISKISPKPPPAGGVYPSHTLPLLGASRLQFAYGKTCAYTQNPSSYAPV